MNERPRYRRRQSQAARAGLEEPAIETRTFPGGGMTYVQGMRSLGEPNAHVRSHGWCPECKELLAECMCESPRRELDFESPGVA